MSLWIDLDNSPHVHFFAPIIRNLDREGIKYFITVRSFSQTEDLARSYGFDFVTIGTHRAHHHVTSRVGETTARAWQLGAYVRKRKATAAVSHNSRALLLASYFLKIPAMTLYDYEFAFAYFSNRVSQKIVVPAEIPTERLLEQGASLDKLIRYPGLKEEVYVYDFQPNRDILSELSLDPHRTIISLRPPQTWAHYHNPRSEVLLDGLIGRLRRERDAQVVVLCRTTEQANAMSAKYGLDSPPFRVLRKAVDGLSLMWYSDAIFSGGGTMVREAALLGLNAHSIFAGKLGAADAALERQGKLKMIRELWEIDQLRFEKRNAFPELKRSSETRDFICGQIVSFARRNQEQKLERVLVREPQVPISRY